MKKCLISSNNSLLPGLVRLQIAIALTLFVGMLCSVLISGFTIDLGNHSVLAASQSYVNSFATKTSNNIKISVLSAPVVKGIAGQFITIEGIVTNLSHNETINGGIAYISIVDIKNKIPIDLEDWSAEKGLHIPFIDAGQSLPLEWNVRLVMAGTYTVDILFSKDTNVTSPPSVSSKVFLEVAPKLNLNPGNVLPVAFGIPALIMGVLGIINYTRGRKTGIYG